MGLFRLSRLRPKSKLKPEAQGEEAAPGGLERGAGGAEGGTATLDQLIGGSDSARTELQHDADALTRKMAQRSEQRKAKARMRELDATKAQLGSQSTDASSAPLGRAPNAGALARAKAANAARGRRKLSKLILSKLALSLSTSRGNDSESSPRTRDRPAHHLDSVLILQHPEDNEVPPAVAPLKATGRRRLSPNAMLRRHRRSQAPWLGVSSPVPEDAPAAQEDPFVGLGDAPVPEDQPAAQEEPSAIRRFLSSNGVYRRSFARREALPLAEPDHVAARPSLGLTTTVAMAVIKFRRLRRKTLPPEVPQGFAVPKPRPTTPPPARPRKKTVRRSILAIGADLLAGLGVVVEAPPTDIGAHISLKAQLDAFLDGSELTFSAHAMRAAELFERLGLGAGSMSSASGGGHRRSIEVHERLLRRKDDLSHRARQVGLQPYVLGAAATLCGREDPSHRARQAGPARHRPARRTPTSSRALLTTLALALTTLGRARSPSARRHVRCGGAIRRERCQRRPAVERGGAGRRPDRAACSGRDGDDGPPRDAAREPRRRLATQRAQAVGGDRYRPRQAVVTTIVLATDY